MEPDALALLKAEQAGVEIRPLDELSRIAEACELFSQLWSEPSGGEPVSPHLVRALELSGNYVFGAFAADGFLAGATIAWAAPGLGDDLHSHITGVQPKRQRSGVGLALKLHQRAWALARGFTSISWTFDPLVRRNAIFNLARLGADVEGYFEDLYGTMSDAINAGDQSDRFLLRWHLERPVGLEEEGGGFYLEGERPTGLWPGSDGAPLFGEVAGTLAEMTVEVPSDIEAMRRLAPATAAQWRSATRAVFSKLYDKGGKVAGLDRAGRYVVVCGEGA